MYLLILRTLIQQTLRKGRVLGHNITPDYLRVNKIIGFIQPLPIWRKPEKLQECHNPHRKSGDVCPG